MDNMEFIELAQKEIINVIPSYFGHSHGLKPSDIYVVWLAKTLQNNKGLFSTPTNGDGLYFEFTHNGDKEECYLDVYTKVENVCIPIPTKTESKSHQETENILTGWAQDLMPLVDAGVVSIHGINTPMIGDGSVLYMITQDENNSYYRINSIMSDAVPLVYHLLLQSAYVDEVMALWSTILDRTDIKFSMVKNG